MPSASKKAQDEVLALSKRHRDKLTLPSKIIEWARKNPSSACHEYFEWDDGKAAQQHRLWQARALIAVIHITPADIGEPVRAFVSVMSDRSKGGGYRRTEEAMAEPLLAHQVIHEAMREAQRWSMKYQHLSQLRDIHNSIRKAAEKLKAPEAGPPRKKAA